MAYKHSHGGHRARLRKKFFDNSNSLEDHELLELLLFYAIPQKDTNALAHALLQRFGSLSGVLNASKEQIALVHGMGDTSSQLFPVVLEVLRRYVREQLSERTGKGYDPKYIGGLYLSKFFGKNEEHVLAVLLNKKFEVIKDMEIGKGDTISSCVETSQLCAFVHVNTPCYVVIAHNHPSGIALPSLEDYQTTDYLRDYVAKFGGILLDHLIFDGRGDFVSLGASDQMAGKNRFRYVVEQSSDLASGKIRFQFRQVPLVADIMTKNQTLNEDA